MPFRAGLVLVAQAVLRVSVELVKLLRADGADLLVRAAQLTVVIQDWVDVES